MKSTILICLIINLTMLASCGTTRHKPDKQSRVTNSGFSMPVKQQDVESAMEDWPNQSRDVAEVIMKKYGLPDIASNDQLIWYDTGPFTRTIVTKRVVDDPSPIAHVDVLQQTINYNVPIEYIDELNLLDSTLVVDRSKGELTAQSDSEELNMLALNMADEVIRKKLDLSEAQKRYQLSFKDHKDGIHNNYYADLKFKPLDAPSPLSEKSIQAQEEAVDFKKKKTEGTVKDH